MKKISFQLILVMMTLALGFTLTSEFVQTTDADGLDDAACANAEAGVYLAFQRVERDCHNNPDFDKCNEAWEALGHAVAYRDLVCDDDDDDNDEGSSS